MRVFSLEEEARSYAADASIDWERLAGRTILITGATGLVGSWCARVLLERNRLAQGGMTVVCLVRSAEKLATVLSGYGPDDGLVVVEGDLQHASLDSVRADYVIHAACPTASDFFVNHPVETADAVVLGTHRLLAYARDVEARGFVYVSSMEVYGQGKPEPGLDSPLVEGDTGKMDPLAVRSSYSEGKRMAEQYCAAFASEYGVPASVVRLAQTFGPGVSADDQRIFALCLRNAMKGDDIVLHTTGASTRMYLYIADAALAILTVLLNGEPGRAYNAANPDTYSSVRQMAEYVAALYPEGGSQVRYEVDPDAPFPPEHHLPLDVSALRALGWHPTAGLDVMFGNLALCFEED